MQPNGRTKFEHPRPDGSTTVVVTKERDINTPVRVGVTTWREENTGGRRTQQHDGCGTGGISESTHWCDGLHQFLQIKHELDIFPESVTTNFISNMGFMKRYGEARQSRQALLGIKLGGLNVSLTMGDGWISHNIAET